jgi:hypothetical protein
MNAENSFHVLTLLILRINVISGAKICQQPDSLLLKTYSKKNKKTRKNSFRNRANRKTFEVFKTSKVFLF